MRKEITLTVFVAVLLLNSVTVLMMAQPASEPHNADAMWIEPSSLAFDATNASVGMTFNVTVWLNMTENVFAYQIALHYDPTQLLCTASDFTGTGGKSQYFAGHNTVSSGPTIDTSFLGNGSILASETLKGTDKITGPKNASLIWAEFQILVIPKSGNLTSILDLTTETTGANNWVWAPPPPPGTFLPFTPYDASYFVGAAPVKPLSVSISPTSTTASVNQNVLHTSTVTGGTPPYSYQWFFLNGTAVSGATSASLTLSSPTPTSYSLYLNVTDNLGAVAKSNVASVTVVAGLSVSITPTSALILVNQALLFNSTAGGGTPPLSYQWFLNESAVSGATSASWTFSPTTNNTYNVYVNVTDSLGALAKSNVAVVTAVLPLSASIKPTSASVGVNQTLLFTSTVSGGVPAYGYQWFLNESAVSGATSSSWTFSSAINGTYTVYLGVTDSNGTTAKSNVASVSVGLKLFGDVNGDGKVDLLDIIAVVTAFGSYGPGGPNFKNSSLPASPGWNPDCDLDTPPDNKVDGRDIVIVALNFGKGIGS